MSERELEHAELVVAYDGCRQLAEQLAAAGVSPHLAAEAMATVGLAGLALDPASTTGRRQAERIVAELRAILEPGPAQKN